MTKLIDTHAHIYLEEFREDIEEVLAQSKEARVDQIYMPNINAKYVLEILPGASDSINIGSVLNFIPPG